MESFTNTSMSHVSGVLDNGTLNQMSKQQIGGNIWDVFYTFVDTASRINPVFYKGIPVIIFTVGVLVNLLLIVYLLRSNRYKSPLFALITSLAFSDLGTCIVAIEFMSLIYPYMVLSNADFLCPVSVYLVVVFYVTSVYHLVLFACLRYIQLCHPLWALAQITWQRVLTSCGIIWGLMITGSTAYFQVYGAQHVTSKNISVIFCEIIGDEKEILKSYYAFFILATFLPAILILLIHCVKQTTLSVRGSFAGKSLTLHEENRRNADPRALVIVISIFYIANLPSALHSYGHLLWGVPYLPAHHIIQECLWLLGWANAFLDPFVYCIASSTVRKDIRKFFCRGR